jgi:hypothetical protein
VTRARAIALTVACAVAVGAPVAAAAGDAESGFLLRMLDRIAEELDKASEARHPVLTPPVAVRVKYKARKGPSIDLGAPLLALTAADLDGDGKAELIAVSESELVVMLYKKRGQPTVVARVDLPGERASMRPRDPVGSVVVSDGGVDGGKQIWVRSSTLAKGTRFELAEGVLSDVGSFDDFPLCEDTFGALSRGRNYFEASDVRWPEGAAQPPIARQFYAVQCRSDIVDTNGCPTDVMAVSAVEGKLSVRADTTCPSGANVDPMSTSIDRELDSIGVAVAVADIDNDGDIEVITSGETAPGDPDRVSIHTWTGDRKKQLFTREFMGGVAAIAAADIDGDGNIEVVSAVRLLGSDRIDFWTLN